MLGTGAMPIVISLKLAKKLKITATVTRIIVANVTIDSCNRTVSNVPVGLGYIVLRLRIMIMNKVLFDVFIGIQLMGS